jgi:hypothetical protein
MRATGEIVALTSERDAARNRAIEECAKVAEDEASEHDHHVDKMRCWSIARAIRSLMNGGEKK